MAGLATVDSITNPDTMFENSGITNIIGEVTHVDTEKKTAVLSNGQTLSYDKLILGTGASPFIPPIEGVGFEGVLTLRSASDAERIRHFLEAKKVEHIVFVINFLSSVRV